jgi:hypothetical protein
MAQQVIQASCVVGGCRISSEAYLAEIAGEPDRCDSIEEPVGWTPSLTAGVTVKPGLEIEDCSQAAAEIFGAAKAEPACRGDARRKNARAIGAGAYPADARINESVEVEAGLRMSAQRHDEEAGKCCDDEGACFEGTCFDVVCLRGTYWI